jgi:sterol 14alpha-demethylase
MHITGQHCIVQVFTVPLLHLRMTFLIGPSVSTHFYNASDDLMSQKEVYGYSVPTFGDTVVFAVDEKVRAEQFRMLADALKSTKMKDYVPTFVKETSAFLAKWGDAGVVDFKDQFSELILFTASATIMGREVRENMFKEVTHLYDALDQGPFLLQAGLPRKLGLSAMHSLYASACTA